MSNTAVTIGGREYVYQGVTDLEIMPLAEVFGTERPEEGTKEYKDWERQFMTRFTSDPVQRKIAFFLLCAFPDLPEDIVRYTVRRLPDGTEECKPGRDLRVKIGAKEFEQIVLIISSELKKIEQKLIQERKPRTESIGSYVVNPIAIKRPKSAPFILEGTDTEQLESNSIQQISSEELTSIVAEVLKQRQLAG